ncbi:nuclear transport factor 2 family protein [Nonomuraea sp. GTA35]|uniref:nuclear transport factor 2 family protein n=1 Tax=Nonomuraea sp. GTA35 TaxID=1676746 RepID=UPI0035BF10CD
MDRLHVINTRTSMAWHVDQRDRDQLVRVFADKVMLDHTSLNGGEPVTLTPARIIEAWETGLSAYAATQHLIGSHLVTSTATPRCAPIAGVAVVSSDHRQIDHHGHLECA